MLLHPTLIGITLAGANLWLLFGATEHQRWIFGGLLSLFLVPLVRMVQKYTRQRTMRLLAESGNALDLILAQVDATPAPPDTPTAR